MNTPESRPSEPPLNDAGLDVSRIRAITLDLDDTLWPIWPTIARRRCFAGLAGRTRARDRHAVR
jgi:hypothetical protein